MLWIMKYDLVSGNQPSCSCQRFTTTQIARITGMGTAGDLQPDTVPAFKAVRS
jgi:hypothetical protein